MADTSFKPVGFVNATAVLLRAAEVSAPAFAGGCNEAAACSPGIGIGIDQGAVVVNDWTLLDQTEPAGAARTPQVGAYIGNDGFTSRASGDGVESGGSAGKGTVGINVYDRPDRPADNSQGVTAPTSVDGQAELNVLATGWESDGTP